MLIKKTIAAAAVALATTAVTVSMPSQVIGQELPAVVHQNPEVDPGHDVLMRYVSYHEEGLRIRFDVDAAKADGVSPDIIRSGEILNDYSFAMQDDESRIRIPIWGNWCGPDYSGPDAPKDLLDTACMHHDHCYSHVYGSCACDEELIAEIDRNFNRMHATEKITARAVKAYFIAARNWCVK